MNQVKWGISIAGIPDGCRFNYLWSAQGNAALWLQQIYVIIFEVNIVGEQKQTYIGHNLFVFIIFHCPNFLLLPMLHRWPGNPVNQLPGLLHLKRNDPRCGSTCTRVEPSVSGSDWSQLLSLSASQPIRPKKRFPRLCRSRHFNSRLFTPGTFIWCCPLGLCRFSM